MIQLAAIAFAVSINKMCAAQVLELRKYSTGSPTYGDLVQTYSGGSDITVTTSMGAGVFLIRSSDYASGPSLSVGRVTIHNTSTSRTVEVALVSRFDRFGFPYAGVVNCGGFSDASTQISKHASIPI